MKLQISFELTNLSDAIDLAKETCKFADILEVGTLLIYKEGIKAVETFKKEFPDKEILADAKICGHVKESVELFAQAGADTITVLAGMNNESIHTAVSTAHSLKTKIALDLVDSYSSGQSAMDAENLGVDSLLFIRTKGFDTDTLNEWHTTKENTKLPITLAGKIDKNNVKQAIILNPKAICIGRAITDSSEPEKDALYFNELVKSTSHNI